MVIKPRRWTLCLETWRPWSGWRGQWRDPEPIGAWDDGTTATLPSRSRSLRSWHSTVRAPGRAADGRVRRNATTGDASGAPTEADAASLAVNELQPQSIEQLFHRHPMMSSHGPENASHQRPELQGPVGWNGDVVCAVHGGRQTHVRPGMTDLHVAEPAQGADDILTADIARQPHGARISSRTK